MSLKETRYVNLYCDGEGCEADFFVEFHDGRHDGRALRRMAKDEGWGYSRRSDGKMVDLCDHCSNDPANLFA